MVQDIIKRNPPESFNNMSLKWAESGLLLLVIKRNPPESFSNMVQDSLSLKEILLSLSITWSKVVYLCLSLNFKEILELMDWERKSSSVYSTCIQGPLGKWY